MRTRRQRTITSVINRLSLSDLRHIQYDFETVSTVPMVVNRTAPKLHFAMSMDPRSNDQLERTYSLVAVLAKAFQVRQF